jgi:hypothetical protein
MNENNFGKKKEKHSWLDEHDSIQSELLKMKSDLIKEEEDKEIDKRFQERISKEEEKPQDRKIEHEPPLPEPKTPSRPPDTGPTIKQMLSGPDADTKIKGEGKNIRRKEGTIPTAPDLTSKIANVIQLENNLKRRKFELEKRAKKREIPPPPVNPEQRVSERKTSTPPKPAEVKPPAPKTPKGPELETKKEIKKEKVEKEPHKEKPKIASDKQRSSPSKKKTEKTQPKSKAKDRAAEAAIHNKKMEEAIIAGFSPDNPQRMALEGAPKKEEKKKKKKWGLGRLFGK